MDDGRSLAMQIPRIFGAWQILAELKSNLKWNDLRIWIHHFLDADFVEVFTHHSEVQTAFTIVDLYLIAEHHSFEPRKKDLFPLSRLFPLYTGCLTGILMVYEIIPPP